MISRRDFLIATGTMAALPIVPAWAATNKPIGIQLYTIRELMNQDPIDTLKHLSAIGFTQLESYQGDKGIYFGLKPTEFARIAHDLGMTL